ncbi:hypothetical protein CJO74_14370 [Ralstonia solanacearum]|nr:hypothetical protein CJO74_14370 [Ralstonia solanacearum]
MAQLYSRRCRYSPLLKLFFDCFAAHDIRRCTRSGPDRQFEDGHRIEAEVFVDFVSTLREQGARAGIVKQLNDWNNNSDENDKRVQRYVDALFGRYGTLVPVHLDLFSADCRIDETRVEEVMTMVAAEHAEDMAVLFGGVADSVSPVEPTVHDDVSDMIAARDRLLDNMRAKPSIFRSMVGYVWRIEWSHTGYYLRTVFLFDGAAPMADIWLGERIGQYWVKSITKSQGTFRNLNMCSTKFAGVGKIDHLDTTKRMDLVQVVRRLARRDRYVCVMPQGIGKRFGMGRMPQSKVSAEARAARRARRNKRVLLVPGWVRTAERDIGNSSFPFGTRSYGSSP